jgi:hypothetical protein
VPFSGFGRTDKRLLGMIYMREEKSFLPFNPGSSEEIAYMP